MVASYVYVGHPMASMSLPEVKTIWFLSGPWQSPPLLLAVKVTTLGSRPWLSTRGDVMDEITGLEV